MAAILEYEYINIMRKTGLPAAISKQLLWQVSVFALESQLKKERPCRWQKDHLDLYYAAGSSRDWLLPEAQFRGSIASYATSDVCTKHTFDQ